MHVLQVVFQNVVGDGGYKFLHLFQVAGPSNDLARLQIAELELSEAELTQDDILKF